MMRLSKKGWSNDVPDKPGWYSFCRQKEWDWWPSSMWPMLVRVDYFSEGVLLVVEDPDWEFVETKDELPHALDVPWDVAATEDQAWMNRAWKPLQSREDFDPRDLPDVSGNRGDAPDEFSTGDKRKTVTC